MVGKWQFNRSPRALPFSDYFLWSEYPTLPGWRFAYVWLNYTDEERHHGQCRNEFVNSVLFFSERIFVYVSYMFQGSFQRLPLIFSIVLWFLWRALHLIFLGIHVGIVYCQSVRDSGSAKIGSIHALCPWHIMAIHCNETNVEEETAEEFLYDGFISSRRRYLQEVGDANTVTLPSPRRNRRPSHHIRIKEDKSGAFLSFALMDRMLFS